MAGKEKYRKQGIYNVLGASKAPELEKRGVGCSGPKPVHMTETNIKESKPLNRGPCRKGFREKCTKNARGGNYWNETRKENIFIKR